MWKLFISCLIHCFLDIVQTNRKPIFKIRESLPFLYINYKWRAKFKINRLLIRDSDWLNLIYFSGYKYEIRLVSRLRKRENQALISISIILKFPALARYGWFQELHSEYFGMKYYNIILNGENVKLKNLYLTCPSNLILSYLIFPFLS